MRIALTSIVIAASFTFAGTAQAQQDKTVYRLLAGDSESATMVSTVTGPQSARKLTNILIAATPGASGADNFVSQVVVNCGTGEIQYPNTDVYEGDQKVNSLPYNDEWRVPRKGSSDDVVVQYACKGELFSGETRKVIGADAARAEARAQMKNAQ